jgi:DMSO/TMAO reductase YedYZ molybdopterin-dependent catalytic subunit
MVTASRAVRSTFTLFHDAAELLLKREEGIVDHLTRYAEAGAAEARALTPVLTGEHRDGIQVFAPTTDENGEPVVPFGSVVPTWHLIEFGSVHNEPSRSITKGAEAAGLDVEPR